MVSPSRLAYAALNRTKDHIARYSDDDLAATTRLGVSPAANWDIIDE